MNHKILTHSGCTINNCNICHGGLEYCTVCEGAEITLTTDCCGKPLTDTQEIRVSNKESDFIDGKWRNKQ